MTLTLDTSRALRSHTAQGELVAAIRDAAPSTQETWWLEWKSGLDLSARASRLVIAKAVLGFANRSPEVAERAVGGCAYFLVGVEPGSVTGVAPVDGAALEGQISTYVGAVVWHPNYVRIDGKDVLVVTVEPPQWGDEIFPLLKEFDGYPRSTIYVRHASSTERASPEDIKMLSKRAAGGQRAIRSLDVDVRASKPPRLRPVDTASLGAYADRERAALLAGLSSSRLVQSAGWLTPVEYGSHADDRSPERFREQVADYVAELRREPERLMVARSFMHRLNAVELEVENNADEGISGLVIVLRIKPSVATWLAL